ncbi:hypothetical protein DFJ74DRAFT_682673 [Hyaloraphidium curvatum]|nr:hypothetical protein DFJ74DRAFT_682673 [Hyaloraphidium curvatum]
MDWTNASDDESDAPSFAASLTPSPPGKAQSVAAEEEIETTPQRDETDTTCASSLVLVPRPSGELTVASAASAFRAMGIRVVPLHMTSYTDAKGQIVKKCDNPSDEQRYRTVCEVKQHHNGLCLVTGEPGGIFVIDGDNLADLDLLLHTVGIPSVESIATVTVTTRKGRHLYFANDDRLAGETLTAKAFSIDGKVLDIDTRGSGGIIYAPPTSYRLPDGTVAHYRFDPGASLFDRLPARMPDALVDVILGRHPAVQKKVSKSGKGQRATAAGGGAGAGSGSGSRDVLVPFGRQRSALAQFVWQHAVKDSAQSTHTLLLAGPGAGIPGKIRVPNDRAALRTFAQAMIDEHRNHPDSKVLCFSELTRGLKYARVFAEVDRRDDGGDYSAFADAPGRLKLASAVVRVLKQACRDFCVAVLGEAEGSEIANGFTAGLAAEFNAVEPGKLHIVAPNGIASLRAMHEIAERAKKLLADDEMGRFASIDTGVFRVDFANKRLPLSRKRSGTFYLPMSLETGEALEATVDRIMALMIRPTQEELESDYGAERAERMHSRGVEIGYIPKWNASGAYGKLTEDQARACEDLLDYYRCGRGAGEMEDNPLAWFPLQMKDCGTTGEVGSRCVWVRLRDRQCAHKGEASGWLHGDDVDKETARRLIKTYERGSAVYICEATECKEAGKVLELTVPTALLTRIFPENQSMSTEQQRIVAHAVERALFGTRRVGGVDYTAIRFCTGDFPYILVPLSDGLRVTIGEKNMTLKKGKEILGQTETCLRVRVLFLGLKRKVRNQEEAADPIAYSPSAAVRASRVAIEVAAGDVETTNDMEAEPAMESDEASQPAVVVAGANDTDGDCVMVEASGLAEQDCASVSSESVSVPMFRMEDAEQVAVLQSAVGALCKFDKRPHVLSARKTVSKTMLDGVLTYRVVGEGFFVEIAKGKDVVVTWDSGESKKAKMKAADAAAIWGANWNMEPIEFSSSAHQEAIELTSSIANCEPKEVFLRNHSTMTGFEGTVARVQGTKKCGFCRKKTPRNCSVTGLGVQLSCPQCNRNLFKEPMPIPRDRAALHCSLLMVINQNTTVVHNHNYGAVDEGGAWHEFEADGVTVDPDRGPEWNRSLLKALSGGHSSISKFLAINNPLESKEGCPFIYSEASGAWGHWSGSRWRYDPTKKKDGSHAVLRYIRQEEAYSPFVLALRVYERLLRDASENGATDEAKDLLAAKVAKIRKVLMDLESDTFQGHVVNQLAAEMGVDASQFDELLDTKPYAVQFNNGTYDLETGLFYPGGRREWMLSYTTGYDFVPLDEVPNVDYERIVQIMKDIYPVEEEYEYAHRASGYSITGECFEQVMHFCLGSASNGKGVKGKAMEYALGDYAGSTKIGILCDHVGDVERATPELMALRGKRCVIISESGPVRKLNVERFNVYTSGNRTSGRFLNGNTVQFSLIAKMWVFINDIPKFDATSDAITRRARNVPYRTKFVDDPAAAAGEEYWKMKDSGLGRELKKPEMRMAMMKWLIEGYRKWKDAFIQSSLERPGDGTGLTPPPSIKKTTDEHLNDNDAVLRWILTNYEVSIDAARIARESVSARELFADYEEHFYPIEERMKMNAFGRHMTKLIARKAFEVDGGRVERTERKDANKTAEYTGLCRRIIAAQ